MVKANHALSNSAQLYKSLAGNQLWHSGRQDWIFSRIGDQEGAISDPAISRKISCVKSGFQILYAVEQFRQIKARSTHTPNPWSAFPAHVVGELLCGSQPTALTSVVWSWYLKDLPREERVFYTRVFPGHWPMAMPCWWAQTAGRKQVSMAATARVIWLCACVR